MLPHITWTKTEDNALKTLLESIFVEFMKTNYLVRSVIPITILLTENVSQSIKKKEFKAVILMIPIKLAPSVKQNNLELMEIVFQF